MGFLDVFILRVTDLGLIILSLLVVGAVYIGFRGTSNLIHNDARFWSGIVSGAAVALIYGFLTAASGMRWGPNEGAAAILDALLLVWAPAALICFIVTWLIAGLDNLITGTDKK